jgi:hypothetical protein
MAASGVYPATNTPEERVRAICLKALQRIDAVRDKQLHDINTRKFRAETMVDTLKYLETSEACMWRLPYIESSELQRWLGDLWGTLDKLLEKPDLWASITDTVCFCTLTWLMQRWMCTPCRQYCRLLMVRRAIQQITLSVLLT